MLMVDKVRIHYPLVPKESPIGKRMANADVFFANEIGGQNIICIEKYRVLRGDDNLEACLAPERRTSSNKFEGVLSIKERLEDEIAAAIFSAYDATKQIAWTQHQQHFRCLAPHFTPTSEQYRPIEEEVSAEVSEPEITLAKAADIARHKGKFLGNAACTIGGELRIHGIRLLRGEDRQGLPKAAMPQSINTDNSITTIAFPLTKGMRSAIQKCLEECFFSASTTSTIASPEPHSPPPFSRS